MNIDEYKEMLKKLSSRRLKSYRRYNFWGLSDNEYFKARRENDAVLAELNTREHVPNKEETKIIRQRRANQKRNNGKRKGQK